LRICAVFPNNVDETADDDQDRPKHANFYIYSKLVTSEGIYCSILFTYILFVVTEQGACSYDILHIGIRYIYKQYRKKRHILKCSWAINHMKVEAVLNIPETVSAPSGIDE
jgi:hypothetical protein